MLLLAVAKSENPVPARSALMEVKDVAGDMIYVNGGVSHNDVRLEHTAVSHSENASPSSSTLASPRGIRHATPRNHHPHIDTPPHTHAR